MNIKPAQGTNHKETTTIIVSHNNEQILLFQDCIKI